MCRKAHIIREANIIRRSRHHLPKANIIEKSSFERTSFFLRRVSDLDAKPCVADLDAHGFCRGYTNSLAMMGVALDRCFPGRNTMLATRPMYLKQICIYTRMIFRENFRIQQFFELVSSYFVFLHTLIRGV